MADKTQKLIIALLIFAILFSAVSIFVSWSALSGIKAPEKSPEQTFGNPSGKIEFVVEGNNPAPETYGGTG